MSFFIAMTNRRAMASYWHPQTIVSESSEFLIVSRSGGRNQFLRVSNAGACSGSETEAPTGLRPELVLLATLVSQGLNGGEIFLVERQVPEGLTFEGRFVGGDGYLLLTETESGVSLKGSARVRSGRRNADMLGKCVFFANDEPGATVHIDATYVPWVHEVLPGGFRGRRAARAGGAG